MNLTSRFSVQKCKAGGDDSIAKIEILRNFHNYIFVPTPFTTFQNAFFYTHADNNNYCLLSVFISHQNVSAVLYYYTIQSRSTPLFYGESSVPKLTKTWLGLGLSLQDSNCLHATTIPFLHLKCTEIFGFIVNKINGRVFCYTCYL